MASRSSSAITPSAPFSRIARRRRGATCASTSARAGAAATTPAASSRHGPGASTAGAPRARSSPTSTTTGARLPRATPCGCDGGSSASPARPQTHGARLRPRAGERPRRAPQRASTSGGREDLAPRPASFCFGDALAAGDLGDDDGACHARDLFFEEAEHPLLVAQDRARELDRVLVADGLGHGDDRLIGGDLLRLGGILRLCVL